MVQKINAHTATVHTASIEVKVMRLEKRQVTQAVFRQLPELAVLAADGSFAGTPWGRVNYCPGKFCSLGSGDHHEHVVWQLGDELYRSAFDTRIRRDDAVAVRVPFNERIAAGLLFGLDPSRHEGVYETWVVAPPGGEPVMQLKGLNPRLAGVGGTFRVVRRPRCLLIESGRKQYLLVLDGSPIDISGSSSPIELVEPASGEEFDAVIEQAEEALEAIRATNRHLAVLRLRAADILALDQLFIAV